MSNFEFQDILNMQYPNPEIEKDFPDKILRAAQFAPFAALTGYDEAVIETARLTDSKLELDEYTKEELNRKLNFISENIDDLPETSIPNFIYSKSPLFSMVFRVLGTHSAPIPHQFFAAHHF